MNSGVKDNTRHAYLDYIRVFATFCVIALHSFYSYFSSSANNTRFLWGVLAFADEISRTAVPLFFMISGYLTLSRDIPSIPSFYKKRFLKIGLPFIIYDVFYYILATFDEGTVPTFKDYLKGLLGSGNAYHLWFVYSILALYLLAPFLRRIVASCTENQLWLLFALSVFQTTIRPFLNAFLSEYGVGFYLTDDGFAGYVGYFILGYILGTYCNKKALKKIIFSLATVAFIVCPILTISMARGGAGLSFGGGYAVNHYIEAAGIFLFFKDKFKRESRVVGAFSAVSFSAYLIHVFVLNMTTKFTAELQPYKAILVSFLVASAISFLWGIVVRFVFVIIKLVNESSRISRAQILERMLR